MLVDLLADVKVDGHALGDVVVHLSHDQPGHVMRALPEGRIEERKKRQTLVNRFETFSSNSASSHGCVSQSPAQ